MIGKLYTTPVTDSLGIQYRCLYYGTFGGMCSPFCATFGEECNLIFSYRILIYPFDVGLGGGYVAFVKPFEVISDPPPSKKKRKKNALRQLHSQTFPERNTSPPSSSTLKAYQHSTSSYPLLNLKPCPPHGDPSSHIHPCLGIITSSLPVSLFSLSVFVIPRQQISGSLIASFSSSLSYVTSLLGSRPFLKQ